MGGALGGKTVACLGGTFNRLHAGHRLLFKAAFELADHVAVGVTSDALVERLRGKQARAVRAFEARSEDVRRLLLGYGAERFSVVPLEDPLAPVARPEFDAIVVSQDTAPRAQEINALRRQAGLPPLKVVVVPLLPAFDGTPISATRILAGEIDEEGRALAPPERLRRGKAAASGTKAAAKGARGR